MSDVHPGLILWAASLLSLERICYIWLGRSPATFRAWFRRYLPVFANPTGAVCALFVCFKILQVGVFGWWCVVFGESSPGLYVPGQAATALALIAAGQLLNWSVFYRLGWTGVLYGAELGQAVPKVRSFPYSLVGHPQYVGTVLSIWGFFLGVRAPHDDWWQLPVLETIYYSLGARLERPAQEGGAGVQFQN